jgi:hypothetical protein
LGALVNYTHRAAAAVVAQKGASPSLAAPASTRHGDKGRTGGKGRNGSTPPPGAPQTQPLTTPITSTPPTSTATSPDPGTKPAVAPKTTPAALGITKAIAAGFGGNMLPILFVALLLSAGAAAGIRLRLGRGR